MQKTCQQCGASFDVTSDDLDFYSRVSPVFGGKKFPIPAPSFCPDCRRQRRLAWRNERTLYHRSCDLCRKSIVTIHSPENAYPVYCNSCWYGDGWDPLSYGININASRPFLQQFRDLFNLVPQRAMVNDNGVMSENSAYCQDVAYAKNCYLCIGMWKAQDCLYCRICDQSKFCVDCEGVKLGTELAYECADSQRLYRCRYLQNSENCTDCAFGFDLKGCSDCLACAGLRQKKYCMFNVQRTKDEYDHALAEAALSTFKGTEGMKTRFFDFIRKIPRKDMNLQNCEDCVGDHLFHCQDVHGFVCTNAQHSRWIERSDGPVWCHDILQSGSPQWCYDCITGDEGNMNCFSIFANQSHNALYCDNCLSSDFLLGCVSLRRRKHCILNRQYSEEEYGRLGGEILGRMIAAGEFGGFFPVALSPFGYNETAAPEAFPLTKKDVLSLGWNWRDKLPWTSGKETVKPGNLAEGIHDVPDEVMNEVLACITCGKNYRIIQQELNFYRTMSIPLPRRCPDCRNLERLARRNPSKLWKRACAKCSKNIETTYTPDRPEIVLCEECYLKEVY